MTTPFAARPAKAPGLAALSDLLPPWQRYRLRCQFSSIERESDQGRLKPAECMVRRVDWAHEAYRVDVPVGQS